MKQWTRKICREKKVGAKNLVSLSLNIAGFGRVMYEKQRHFHGLAYRRLTRLQARLLQLELDLRAKNSGPSAAEERRPEDVEQLFFIPQDFSRSADKLVVAVSMEEGEEESSPETLAEYFDLLPSL